MTSCRAVSTRNPTPGSAPLPGAGPLARGHVLVGLSGGVDSAVAALLLQRQGFDVTGLLLRIPYADPPERDAQRVADHLGIPLLLRDLGDEFVRTVVADFVSEYAAGRTPNPCVHCNPAVKFPALLQAAGEVGAQWIATGHYAGLCHTAQTVQLLRDDASGRDQSYMLHRLTQPILARLLLPLTGMDKAAVRQLARQAGLPVADKRDSQDICFVPDGDHVAFLQRCGAALPEGDFVNAAGHVLGRHRGIARYTVGQRKGLGIAADTRLFVTAISAANNTVTLGREQELLHRALTVGELHFISGLPMGQPFRATVKLRFGAVEPPATLTPLQGNRLRIAFDTPVRAPAPGQSAVFYQGDVVLGGGVIEAVE